MRVIRLHMEGIWGNYFKPCQRQVTILDEKALPKKILKRFQIGVMMISIK